MPKLGPYWNIQIAFSARDELRDKLIALSYLRGDGGEYASIARDIMEQAVTDYIEEMDPQEKKEFREILESVKVSSAIDKAERAERLAARLKIREPSTDLQAGDGVGES